jgi:hypothetical protein
VETPGTTYSPISSSTSAASFPAMRILAICSGVLRFTDIAILSNLILPIVTNLKAIAGVQIKK